MVYLYILRNVRNRLYIGHAENLDQCISDHKTNHGAKFIKDHGNFNLVYTEKYSSRAEAMKREKQLKGWTRAKKEALIANDLALLKRL
jgi:predicted GIY-YIG superfamily endonuclease